MNTLAVACVLLAVGVAVAHRGGGGGNYYGGYYGGSDDGYDYRAMMVKKALSVRCQSSCDDCVVGYELGIESGYRRNREVCSPDCAVAGADRNMVCETVEGRWSDYTHCTCNLEDGCNRDAQCDDYDAPLVTNLFGQRFCCKNNRNTAALIFSVNDNNQVECQCAL